jgi:multiple antibiotic resistance protein
MTAIFAAIFSKAFQLFLVLDPIGNTGIIATLISGFSKERQRTILYRELMFALMILMVMLFLGNYLLTSLGISQAAVTITGGIIFFLFALSLLFPGSNSMVSLKNLSEEPFFVPIATPLIVGPSSTATVILFSHDPSMTWWSSLLAVISAWIATAIIVLLGPFLLSKVGKTGMMVAERMIGMICALIAVKMILKGLKLFFATI